MATSPEPVLNFAAKMSGDEVESLCAAAVEHVPEEISCEEMQSSTHIRFRKSNEHDSNNVSHVFNEEKSESDIQHILCIVNETYVDEGIFIILFLHSSENNWYMNKYWFLRF